MDANAKKTVLRMLPYGLYALTAKGKDDAVAATDQGCHVPMPGRRVIG